MSFSHVLMAIAVAVIWGMGFIVAKSAISHFPPIFLMALRFTLTALCLIWFFRPPFALLKQLFWLALIGSTIQYSLTFNGVAGIDASTAALVVQLEVPFGLLTAWILLGDRITLQQSVGIALAFVGTIIIVGEPKLQGKMIYVVMVIGGALTWAIAQVMIKKLGVQGGFVLIAWLAALASPQLFVASWIFEKDQIEALVSAPVSIWLGVVYLGLVMTALAYAMWYYLLGLYDVNRVMPFLLLLPLSAVLGGVVFLDETLTRDILVGGALSIVGVGLITIRFDEILNPLKSGRTRDGSS
ncbi:MAG: EamA family transporter [Pseudomonadota bacterium]